MNQNYLQAALERNGQSRFIFADQSQQFLSHLCCGFFKAVVCELHGKKQVICTEKLESDNRE